MSKPGYYTESQMQIAVMLAELHRFREREPLVQELLTLLDQTNDGGYFEHTDRLGNAVAQRVRDFMLRSENSAVDPEPKTGDKPGADSDDTSEVGESSNKSHLSSVVEQRFRKPLDSQAAEQASGSKPVKARKPICDTCNDAHRMPFGEDRDDVMCTRCPIPCAQCGGKPLGPYCVKTPCDCACHSDDWRYKNEQASSAEPVKARIEADGCMSVADALQWSDAYGPQAQLRDGQACWALSVEVRRLREQLEASRAEVVCMSASLKHQDEKIERLVHENIALAASALVDARAEVSEHVRVVESMYNDASAKIERIRSIVQHGAVTQKSIYDALRDEPQPEREPKLPYNGY